MKVARELLEPNGITLSGDNSSVYLADQLGGLRVELKTGESVEGDPGSHSTPAGVDGLYWHKGSLIAIQNGIGTPRVAAFLLTKVACTFPGPRCSSTDQTCACCRQPARCVTMISTS